MLALTFDDGPGKYTDLMLDILARYNVPATFFIIGRQVADYPETVARMAEQGCEVAGHTWDHPSLTGQTEADMAHQMNSTADAIEAASGVRPTLVRPPYGDADETVKKVAGEQGFALVTWSVDPLDWQSLNADAVADAILEAAAPGAFVLSHDLYASTCDDMERVIPALLEQGYQLVTVSTLLEADGGAVQAGHLYRRQ
jgi:peptidoglycan/xylan/chitin deacetylase (PgdA/CDA1 family)